MDGDELSDVLDDANPRCPRCLVLLDAHGEPPLVYLQCPQCEEVLL